MRSNFKSEKCRIRIRNNVKRIIGMLSRKRRRRRRREEIDK